MISVIICTYNPKHVYLERTVQSILQQQFPMQDVDFFIVDNNSSSPVEEIPFIANNRIRVVHEPVPGLTAARECGSRNAKGDLIVYVDDDNILDASYLKNVNSMFQNPLIGIVSGHIIPEYEQTPESWFLPFEPMLAIRRVPMERSYLTTIPLYNEHFPIGAGICIRTKIIRDYFNSINDSNRIEGRVGNSLSSGEDLDIDFFAIHQGYAVGSNGTLKLRHIIPPQRCTVGYISRLAVSSAQSTWQINQKWRPVFNADVFTMFAHSQRSIIVKMFYYAATRWRERSSVLFQYNKKLLSLQRSRLS